MASAVDNDTMIILGSAPCFPHGVVDEILPLSRVAESADVWLHIYACVGGYHAPFAKSLGRDMPDFDFSFPGVRSLTAYLQEFGFAPKPSSTVLYRSEEDFERQIFDLDPRTYGRMTTSTLVGARALSSALDDRALQGRGPSIENSVPFKHGEGRVARQRLRDHGGGVAQAVSEKGGGFRAAERPHGLLPPQAPRRVERLERRRRRCRRF